MKYLKTYKMIIIEKLYPEVMRKIDIQKQSKKNLRYDNKI